MIRFLETSYGYVASELGAFGQQSFGNPTVATSGEELWDILARTFPYSPLRFKCVPGLEGPQSVLTWSPPTKEVGRIIIRRKQREYPRDPDDGVLVLDDTYTPNSRTSYVDNTISRVLWAMTKGAELYGPSEILYSSEIAKLPGVSSNNWGLAADAAIAEVNVQFGSSLSVAGLANDGKYSVTDIAEVLAVGDLTDTDTPTDCAWWYYRMFVQPDQPGVSDQFAGRGEQELASAAVGEVTIKSEAVDAQEFKNVSVVVANTSAVSASVAVRAGPTAPTALGDGVVIATFDVDEESLGSVDFASQSHKFIWIQLTGGDAENTAEGTVWFVTNRSVHWQSGPYLSAPCLTYVTGRHQALLWEGGLLPEVYRAMDERSDPDVLVSLQPALTDRGWVNLKEDTRPRGPLYRFLKSMTLELDRDYAYYEAMRKYDHDIDHAPADVLKHIAFELGWEINSDRDLVDVREELFRIVGMYKSKATPELIQAVSAQAIGVLPRVQEGGGLVLRSADPDLFTSGSSS